MKSVAFVTLDDICNLPSFHNEHNNDEQKWMDGHSKLIVHTSLRTIPYPSINGFSLACTLPCMSVAKTSKPYIILWRHDEHDQSILAQVSFYK